MKIRNFKDLEFWLLELDSADECEAAAKDIAASISTLDWRKRWIDDRQHYEREEHEHAEWVKQSREAEYQVAQADKAKRDAGLEKCHICKQWISSSTIIPWKPHGTIEKLYCRKCAHSEGIFCWVCGDMLRSVYPKRLCGEHNTKLYRQELWRILDHLRRTRHLGLESTLTLIEWLDTLKHFNFTCAYCSGPFSELDHFISISNGGGTTAKNCVPCCKVCNTKKRDRDAARLFQNAPMIAEYLNRTKS